MLLKLCYFRERNYILQLQWHRTVLILVFPSFLCTCCFQVEQLSALTNWSRKNKTSSALYCAYFSINPNYMQSVRCSCVCAWLMAMRFIGLINGLIFDQTCPSLDPIIIFLRVCKRSLNFIIYIKEYILKQRIGAIWKLLKKDNCNVFKENKLVMINMSLS